MADDELNGLMASLRLAWAHQVLEAAEREVVEYDMAYVVDRFREDHDEAREMVAAWVELVFWERRG